ncbi:efflux RND transporter periplasmic adaptor subunit [Legionella jamestowniensis]|uniref:Efflux transporter periplasmic adaptor subunit n=1 Tax=Legionella jamestowniensis TaxID=455 RepID=A0A0W0UU33_9GAMM|nr:efflux RND transporter periplasmic adaptor subunit [Legionella jamestowniensis]KTD11393.1 HlyD family transporter secretion protein [Legionella jamestowniensis]OCH98750.1 efflux transporter periplasmic adaptor subunit [Legionella jamestowniensis]SFL68007.1 RND family efflux transporter, MFP subunit [Legionella jamestowniensis DSM 19215]
MNEVRLVLKNIIILFLSTLLISCERPSSSSVKLPLAEVDVAYPLKKNIIEWDEYTGRFQAVEEVDIRSRVTGYLDAIKFKDGQLVKTGDILFIIDPRPFEYALERAKAQYELTKKQYERAIKLKKESFIAAEEIDQRFQEMRVAETRLDEAKLNLEFTKVKSPISGKISRYYVSVGNLIRSNETILTKVVSINPIYFYFEVSQNDLLKYIRLAEAGKRPDQYSAAPIIIKLQDEKDYPHKGTMNFFDNVVDRDTGTILGRATVPNPEGIIYPGLFGRARLVGSEEYEALLLPDTAINTDQTRKFVYVVDKNNKVQRVYVELGPIRDSSYYIIRNGLKGDERVVVNGIQRIRVPGQEVKPLMVQLQE